MEAATPVSGTGSRTMADFAKLAAERYAPRRALSFKRETSGTTWATRSSAGPSTRSHHHHGGRKNVTPANLENGLRQSRWISPAVVIADRRRYLVALVTLDPDEAPAFAEQHGPTVEELSESEQMRAEVQRTVDEVNARVGPVEQIKKFAIPPRELTQETGELTPTLKVRRPVVSERNEDVIEALYAE